MDSARMPPALENRGSSLKKSKNFQDKKAGGARGLKPAAEQDFSAKEPGPVERQSPADIAGRISKEATACVF